MRKSLQWRVSIGLAAGVALLWIATTIVTGLIVKHEMDEAFDEALAQAADHLLPPVVYQLLERFEREEHEHEGEEDEHTRPIPISNDLAYLHSRNLTADLRLCWQLFGKLFKMFMMIVHKSKRKV